MPGKAPSNMQGWIQDRNPGPAGVRSGQKLTTRGSNDDLKVAVNKTAAAPNTRQTRGGTHQTGHPASQHPHRSHPQGQGDSHEARAFYDTDAGSIDGTSITTNERPLRTTNAGPTQPGDAEEYDEGSDVYTDDTNAESASDDGSEEDLPVNPLGSSNRVAVSSKQQQMMKTMSRQKQAASGHGLPYIPGDSYPPTTSGRPSVAESVPKAEPISDTRKTHHQSEHLAMKSRHTDPATHTQSRHQSSVVPNDQNTNNGLLLTRPDGLNASSAAQQTSGGFSFSKPKEQKLATHQTPRQHASGGHTGASATAVSVSNNTAQSGSTARVENVSRQIPQRQRLAEQSTKLTEDPMRERQPPIVQKHDHPLTTKQPRPYPEVLLEPPESEQLSDREESPEEGLHESLPLRSENQLDYEPPVLFELEYTSLRNESFDTDPNGKTFDIPNVEQDASLDTRLCALSKHEPQDQADYLASIPMREWEEAGDWFLTQFSGVLGKLKDARQQKRRAAKCFEDEIESRHGAVSKKRKLTEDELGSMKKSGGQVLQGTPKKNKMR